MKRRVAKKLTLILTLLAAILLSGVAYAVKEYFRGHRDTSQLVTDYRMNATDLVKQFEANEVRATAEYVNKVISIRGEIGVIHVHDSTVTVLLRTPYSFSSVICEFETDNAKGVNRLQVGQDVNIKGICSGFLMDVVLTRCVTQLN